MINPVEPNARTCPDCGEPYIAEWIDLSHCIAGGAEADGFRLAVGARHSPCPARPETQPEEQPEHI